MFSLFIGRVKLATYKYIKRADTYICTYMSSEQIRGIVYKLIVKNCCVIKLLALWPKYRAEVVEIK